MKITKTASVYRWLQNNRPCRYPDLRLAHNWALGVALCVITCI